MLAEICKTLVSSAADTARSAELLGFDVGTWGRKHFERHL
jgi:hypothetical protein